MKNLNVYIFWLGDEKKRKEIKNKFDDYHKDFPNIHFHIGPTKEEHEFLLANSKCYKQFNDLKIYAFMSDVYRIWKLANNDGMYMDATMLINKRRFNEFISLTEKHQNILLRESPVSIWNGLIYSTNQLMFKRIYNFYESFPYIMKKMLIGPQVLSFYTYNEYGIKMKNSSQIYWLTAIDVDPKNDNGLFKYNGMGSWKKVPGPAIQFFNDKANEFKQGEKKILIITRLWIKWFYIYLLPWMLLKRMCFKFKRIKNNKVK